MLFIISDIEDLIQKKVSVILINPTDSDAVVSAVEAANKANIPVITVDRASNGGGKSSSILPRTMSRAAEYIMKTLGGKGNVVELQGIAGTYAARDRGQGSTMLSMAKKERWRLLSLKSRN